MRKIVRNLRITAEVVDVLQFRLRWLDRFAQRNQAFDSVVQARAASRQTILE